MRLTLLAVHLVLSGMIGLMGYNNINKQERFCNFLMALFFPVGGYINVIILYLSRNKESKKIEDRDEIDNIHVLFTDRFNREKDTNIVSLEETLLINDTKIKRKQLLNSLKKDFSKYIDMLKIALRDEDVETSHYAASAIAEIKRNIELKLQRFSAEYEKNKFDIEILIKYEEVLEEYFKSGLFDEYSLRKVAFEYSQVLETLVKSSEENEAYHNKLINVLLKNREYEKAGKYCKDFLRNYETQNAYLANLRYYYLLKDKKNFDVVFNKLLKSPIKLSNNGLNTIRFWLDGA